MRRSDFASQIRSRRPRSPPPPRAGGGGRRGGRGATLVIALSHLGLADDQLLVESVPGIDLVIGAHSHDLLEAGRDHAGVLIAQAGQYAEALGIIQLQLDPITLRPIERKASVQRVNEDEPPDPAFLTALAEAEAEVE